MRMKVVRKNSQINVHFIGDKEIQTLNKMHRNKDYPTDVLSFNIGEKLPSGTYYIGDVIVNVDQANRQKDEFGNDDVRKELAQLVEHGILHLMGIHHEGKGGEKSEDQPQAK